MSVLKFAIAAVLVGVLPCAVSAQIAPPADVKLSAKTATQAYYAARPEARIWQDKIAFAALMSALEGLEAHGLDPDFYHRSALADPDLSLEAREWLATDAWFTAAAHMVYGKLDAVTLEPDWTAAKRQADLPAMLDKVRTDGTIAGSFDALAPQQKGYKALLSERARLMTVAEVEIVQIAAGELLRAGMSSARVKTLQTRLMQLGVLAAGEVSGVMDAATVEAVKVFQTRAGLNDDGVVGAGTLGALNRGVQGQIEQVDVNLERWRWLPDELGRRHLRANIADFNVTAYKDGVAERTHLTIVGKTFRKTPVFSDEVDYIVLNPWWETPPSLARADKLPLFKRDPAAVQRLGFQVLDRSGTVVNASTIDWNAVPAGTMPYRIRQAPGDQNALGQVKIIFPNKHNVYFHDTPTRGLFAQRQRAFSSGCLRTQDPIDLSEWLLNETPNWGRDKIDAALVTKKETRVNLASKVPVHILYSTVVSEEGGGVRYLDDIYQRDAAVLTGLRAPPR
jgi:murein L,D-transpeptidase YcbB/YkuD